MLENALKVKVMHLNSHLFWWFYFYEEKKKIRRGISLWNAFNWCGDGDGGSDGGDGVLTNWCIESEYYECMCEKKASILRTETKTASSHIAWASIQLPLPSIPCWALFCSSSFIKNRNWWFSDFKMEFGFFFLSFISSEFDYIKHLNVDSWFFSCSQNSKTMLEMCEPPFVRHAIVNLPRRK